MKAATVLIVRVPGGITKVEDTTVLTVRVPVIIIRMLNIA